MREVERVGSAREEHRAVGAIAVQTQLRVPVRHGRQNALGFRCRLGGHAGRAPPEKEKKDSGERYKHVKFAKRGAHCETLGKIDLC